MERLVAFALGMIGGGVAGFVVGTYFEPPSMADPGTIRVRELLRSSEEILHDADDLIRVLTYDTRNTVVTLSELETGNTACAVCILEARLESDITDLENFIEEANESSDLAFSELDHAKTYLSDHPTSSRAECKLACGH